MSSCELAKAVSSVDAAAICWTRRQQHACAFPTMLTLL